MLSFLNIAQLVLYVALLALVGQGLLYVLAGANRDRNIFYQLLQIVSKPFTLLVRKITPKQVADHQVPLVTFFLLLIIYAVVTFEKIALCVEAGMEGLPMKRLPYLWLKGQAVVWLLFGRSAQAMDVFQQMVQRYPQEPYPRASRAHLHAQAGRHAQALEDFEALLQLQPEDARTWFNKGFVLEQLERWDEALAAFRRATDFTPKLDRAWYGQGLVLIRLQRFDEAIVALKRNTELQPMSPHGWYQLARVHVDRKQPDEAVKIIRHLKGFEPKVAAQLERETGLLVGGTGP